MSFSFPTEVVREGKTSIVVPKLEAYVGKTRKHAPSKAPVFYNPIMKLNRDLAILTLQAYQRMAGREISVCEPLTGCGIRGIRLVKEVEGVRRVVLNDINSEAANLTRFNVERSESPDLFLVTNEDANLLLSRYAAPRRRFDYIDIDPFGSPVPYIDSALRALRDGGLLALTATDMAPLCGVYPKACVRKYGGKPLRTEYCHELAVRLLVGCLTVMAAKHEIGINVVFAHSTDHYIRAYAVVHYGAKKADTSLQKMGYILHCFSCLHREPSEGIFSFLKRDCPECGSKLNSAGPLWLDNLFDEKFCALMEKEMEEKGLKQDKKIVRLFSLVRNEVHAPITYYVVDKVCDKLNLPIPPLVKVIDELKKASFQAALTHFTTRGIRTGASAKAVNEVITKLTAQT